MFLFLHLDVVPRNSTPGGFAYIWKSKCVGIIAIKTGRTQIYLLSDVLVAVASLDLKVPIVPYASTIFIFSLNLLVLEYLASRSLCGGLTQTHVDVTESDKLVL